MSLRELRRLRRQESADNLLAIMALRQQHSSTPPDPHRSRRSGGDRDDDDDDDDDDLDDERDGALTPPPSPPPVDWSESAIDWSHRDHLWFMTPRQEAVNAATMLAPAGFCVVYYLRHAESMTQCGAMCAFVFMVSVVLHAPASIAYHLKCMGRSVDHPVFNFWRALDHALMHACAPLAAFALSGSVVYSAANALPNVLFIARTGWTRNAASETSDASAQRRLNVGCAIAMYTLPMAARGDWVNYAGAWGSLVVPVLAFWFNGRFEAMQGWGSTILHAGLLPYAFFLVRSAGSLAEPMVMG